MSNFKTYNPKPSRICAEGLYKPGYSLYFTTWTRDIRIGKELITYLHPYPNRRVLFRRKRYLVCYLFRSTDGRVSCFADSTSS